MLEFLLRNKHCLNIIHRRSYGQFAYTHQISKKPLLYNNLGQQVERAVEKYGAKVAIKSDYDQKKLTFEESYKEGLALAVELNELGLKQGDHLAIWAPNTIQWYITFLASVLGGFPLVCINPALEVPELDFALNKARVKCLITMDAYGKLDFLGKLELLKKTKRTLQSLSAIIIKSASSLESYLDYDKMLSQKGYENLPECVASGIKEILPEGPAAIQFTSGTTGLPKAALISHFSMVNQSVYMGKALRVHEGNKSLCLTVPMFHAFGLSIVVSCLQYGCSLCLPSPVFNATATLDCIEREKCNVVVGTPTMFVDLLDKQSRLHKSVESLETALVGGSACTPDMITQTRNVFRLREVVVGYGLSEGTAAVCAQDGSETAESALNSVGKVFGHGEAKVVSDDGKTLKFGEVGELQIRGWFNMLGYFEDEENTRRTIDSNGWLKTGDLFLLESNGVARYQGRKKDVIIRGGENIFPKEIEDFLDQHKSVLESQVIGVPDRRLGEEICAYIRLKQNAKPLSREDVNEFCQGQLAAFKIPKYVRIVDGFPKTTSGKIQKFKLLELFTNE